MKVNGNDSNSKAKEALQLFSSSAGAKKSSDPQASSLLEGNSSDGQVRVGLASLISREFDSTKMDADRRAKVEDLKKKIANGEYKPDSLAVAQALTQEISMAIMTEGAASAKDE